jgi:hypothetical protein
VGCLSPVTADGEVEVCEVPRRENMSFGPHAVPIEWFSSNPPVICT